MPVDTFNEGTGLPFIGVAGVRTVPVTLAGVAAKPSRVSLV